MDAVLFFIGALVALVGLYLCLTGAPGVTASSGGGFWPIVGTLPPRFVSGVVLLLIGGYMMGANFDALVGSTGK
jgi:hypothetical protein